jgi:5-enolpyruvylshikimate-3-phosphate synthase
MEEEEMNFSKLRNKEVGRLYFTLNIIRAIGMSMENKIDGAHIRYTKDKKLIQNVCKKTEDERPHGRSRFNYSIILK